MSIRPSSFSVKFRNEVRHNDRQTEEQAVIAKMNDRNFFITWAIGRGYSYKDAVAKYKRLMKGA